MEITATLVRDLRERTGAGMMECKKALVENGGDLEKAIEFLQIKGLAKAAKKADRVAADGLVATFVSNDLRTGAIVEVNCETDFVARNEDFVGFANQLAAHAANNGVGDLDALLASSIDGTTVEDIRKAKVASIGENITVRRVARFEAGDHGFVGTYIHGGGTRGVLALFSSDKAIAPDTAAALAKDVCMHVAASNPRFTRQDEIDPETVEREQRILTEQALESGKPREIVEKMIVGRMVKWKQEICLVDQPFVKNPELTVAKEIDRVGKESGAKVAIVTFAHFVRGEGIEKQASNLADEVAALTR
jgi:elongation factor Ts